MLQLEIFNSTHAKIPYKIFHDLLTPARKWLIKDKKIKLGQIFHCELSLVGNHFITRLNKKYHKKNRPTDVISLSYFSPRMADPFLGEIFISVPFAKMQSEKIGQSLYEELRFLFIHGLLHLFGYDHKKMREEKHMRQLTYRILGRAA